ncbi:MAG: hypothetical protein IT501_01975, partial [Rubrivivax sp.]|nr:hypothetical protein [Rubrivivax sp.]
SERPPATPPPHRPRSERPPRPAAPESPAPASRERDDAPSARCADLLQRMQIGEPLTPEQMQFFQSRCSR